MSLAALLPPNSTPLERAVVDALAVGTDPSIIRRYHNPDACPTELLPLLAWERHVDGADAAATPDQLRELIKRSFELHRLRGTPWAVLTALAAIGYPRARLTEWWEQTPQGHPGTFRVTLPWQPALAAASEWARIKSAVAAYKNIRSWPEWETVIVPIDHPDDPGSLPDDPDAWPSPTLQTYARASLATLARYNAPTPAGTAAIPHARAAAGLIARPALAAGQLGAAASAGAGAAVIARLGALPPDSWRTWSAVSLRRALRAAHSTGGAAGVRVRYHAAAPAAATLQVAARYGIGVALVTRLGQPAKFDAWRPILLTDDGGPLLTDDGGAIEL